MEGKEGGDGGRSGQRGQGSGGVGWQRRIEMGRGHGLRGREH